MFSDEYTSTTNCWGIHLSLYHRFVNLFLFTSSQCLNWVWNLINIINSELWCWLCKSCFLLAKVLITPCSMRSCEQLPCSRVPYTLTAVTWYLHSDNTIFVMFSPFWRQDKRQIYFWCVWYFFYEIYSLSYLTCKQGTLLHEKGADPAPGNCVNQQIQTNVKSQNQVSLGSVKCSLYVDLLTPPPPSLWVLVISHREDWVCCSFVLGVSGVFWLQILCAPFGYYNWLLKYTQYPISRLCDHNTFFG